MQYTLRATKEKFLIGTQTVLRHRRSGCLYLDQDIQHKLRKKVKPPDGMQQFLDSSIGNGGMGADAN